MESKGGLVLPVERAGTKLGRLIVMQKASAPRAGIIDRVANRAKREIYGLPAVRAFLGYQYLQALEAHSVTLPPLDPKLLPRLPGAACRSALTSRTSRPWGWEGTGRSMLAGVRTRLAWRELRVAPARRRQRAALALAAGRGLSGYLHVGARAQSSFDFIENYVGLPIRYHGADLRREVADGKLSDVRQWHIDAEDRRMFKMIVYLNEVKPGGGPFQYLPRDVTVRTARRLGYRSGFVRDDEMSAVLPVSEWVECLAPSHSAVMADTCKVFHRAQPPRSSDRYSVTFSWTSTSAIKSYPTMALSSEDRAYIRGRTSERQRACLPAL